jgi:hypothetical protein
MRILTSNGVHHEQIKRMSESLRIMYSQRKEKKPQSMQGCISVYRDQGAVSPGSSGMQKAGTPDTGAGIAVRERPKVPAIRCRKCGEQFPVLDFHYTKKTGLCIPCWERKVR